MNIVVCVKYVPDAQADRTFNASDNTTDRANVDGLLSELDEYAVEAALKIVEAGEGEVTVVTVGPDQAADAIKKALQMGAHKGVHVKDDAIHGSDAPATSLVLAEAIKKVTADAPADLVITGMASTDGTMGVVPTMLAERLGLPAVTYASELTVDGGKAFPYDPPRRRRVDADHRGGPPGARVGHRPDQRAALPVLQGHHGGQEEAGRAVEPRRPRHRRAARSASTPRGPRSSPSRPARRARRAPSSPTRATAASKLAAFLAERKFI